MNYLNLIKVVDAYGQPINFSIKGEFKSKTIFGASLTILTFIILIVIGWSTGKDIIYKNNPTINMEDQLYAKRPFFQLNNETFPIAFCLQDNNQMTYTISKYFAIELFKVITYNTNTTTIINSMEIEPCTYSNFPRFSEVFFNSSGINTYQCAKHQNLTVGGDWGEELINYLTLRIRLCNNLTDGGICAPIEEITNFFKSTPLALNLYYQNSIINTKNYTDPIQYYLGVAYKSIKLSSSKIISIWVREETIITDQGILLESLNSQSSYSFDNTDNDDTEPNPSSLTDLVIYGAAHHPIYHRNYIKVQNILAYLGGLAKAIMFFAYYIAYYFADVNLNVNILNNIYKFTDPEKKIVNNTNLNTVSKINLLGKSSTNITPSMIINQNIINNNDANIIPFAYNFSKKKMIINKSKEINFGFCEVIKMSIFKKCVKSESGLKNKIMVYLKAKKTLDNYLEISNLVNFLEQFEKFKQILFNKDQLCMFNNLEIETFDFNNINSESETNELIAPQQKTDSLIKSILLYKNQLKSYNEIDEKLFKMLSDEIKLKLDQ